jgi:2-dehydropantoate 2-reductase
MQFAVIGAGNIGCIYGANLARIGEPVVMLDVWQEHVDAMRSHGLRMDGLHGEFSAPVMATSIPAEARKADVALICVNSYSTAAAAQSAKELLKPSGVAVTLQNGLGNLEILAEALGSQRVMAGLTFHSADLHAPGRVTHNLEGPTYLGEIAGTRSPRLEALCALLERAGLHPVFTPDVVAMMWQKFVYNCAINALCALTRLRPGHIQEVPAVDEMQTRIIEEALALVRARGITLPDPDILASIKTYCKTKFHRVSMVQHLERGRPTEIDSLNGYVARESEKLGLRAPYNAAVTMLTKGLETRIDSKA